MESDRENGLGNNLFWFVTERTIRAEILREDKEHCHCCKEHIEVYCNNQEIVRHWVDVNNVTAVGVNFLFFVYFFNGDEVKKMAWEGKGAEIDGIKSATQCTIDS